MSKPVALQMEKVTRSFQQAGHALNVLAGVDLTLCAGELVALVGPSGSGKTTLLQIAGLLDQPTGGAVTIAGQDATLLRDRERTLLRRQSLGFVYQFHHLLPEFSALENVAMPQMIADVEEGAAKRHAQELLEMLGLGARLDHRPAQLSGGEQQRVAIARAMSNQPVLILADEPTGNLDPETADHVFSLFMKAAKERGVAALIATHNMEIAARMDRTVVMQGGRVA